jgi:large subunit ribosomal protein L24
MHVKTGDTVQIIAGRDKGQTGKVLRIDAKHNRVVIEGLNLVKRHQKAGAGAAEAGIIEKEAPIHASNVLLFSEELERGVRTQNRYVGQGGEFFSSRTGASASFGDAGGKVDKVRVCQKTGEVFK